MTADVDWPAQGKQMPVFDPIRKACQACGRPMKAVPDDAREGRSRYVCANCDHDPLHDPAALKWAFSPLRPPAK
jgi:hypothetical protein